MLDRLKRLGIPLLFYSFILSPVMNYLVYSYGERKTATFWQYLQGYDSWINFGVMWFVAALLLFTFLFVICSSVKITVPKVSPLLFLFLLGLVTFVVRLLFPVGWVLHPVGFQLGHFPQYIALFITGILASRNNWLSYSISRTYGWFALFMILVIFPVILIVHSKTGGALSNFQGGLTYESFVYSIWEQLTGGAIILWFLRTFREKWNGQSLFMQTLSRASFATYIFHPLVLISLSLVLSQSDINPLIKLLIVAPCGVLGSFLLGLLLVKIKSVSRII